MLDRSRPEGHWEMTRDSEREHSEGEADAALLAADHVSKEYAHRRRPVGKPDKLARAVDDVSLRVEPGRTLAVVGESGCGKSTTARLLTGLEVPSQGRVLFEGMDIASLDRDSRTRFRRAIQIMFQDVNGALNPRKTVRRGLLDILTRVLGERPSKERVEAALEEVGLTPPTSYLDRYPHQLSGGQRQRVVLAKVLLIRPRVIIADEPVSALDASVQAQILTLLHDLQSKYGLSYVLISHDLGVVRAMADDVAVMYGGRIVEQGPVQQIFERPVHPYTRLLLAATLVPDPRFAQSMDDEPDTDQRTIAANPGWAEGCGFRSRCSFAVSSCGAQVPTLEAFSDDHRVRCLRAKDVASSLPAPSGDPSGAKMDLRGAS